MKFNDKILLLSQTKTTFSSKKHSPYTTKTETKHTQKQLQNRIVSFTSLEVM